MIPGDRAQLDARNRKLDDLIRDLSNRVGRLEGLRAAPPLRIDTTPAGNVMSLIQTTTSTTAVFSGAAVTASLDQSAGGVGGSALAFDTEAFDTAGYFNVSTPTHLLLPNSGYYAYGFVVSVVGATNQVANVNSSFFGPIGLGANASGYLGSSVIPGFGNVTLAATGLVYAASAGYIQLLAADSSGSVGTFTVKARSGFWIVKLG